MSGRIHAGLTIVAVVFTTYLVAGALVWTGPVEQPIVEVAERRPLVPRAEVLGPNPVPLVVAIHVVAVADARLAHRSILTAASAACRARLE